jgi:hypothetical protein
VNPISEGLAFVLIGLGLIAGATALTWEYWVDYRDERSRLMPNFATNAVATGPLIALVGLVLIGFGFAAQPLVAGLLVVAAVPLGWLAVRAAWRYTERKRADRKAEEARLAEQAAQDRSAPSV